MENLQQYSYAELTQFLLVIYEEMDRQFYF